MVKPRRQLDPFPWNQGHGYDAPGRKESDESFARFQYFLQLGPRRTQAAVARHFKLTTASVCQMAARFNWGERAKAYDKAVKEALGEPDPTFSSSLTGKPLPQASVDAARMKPVLPGDEAAIEVEPAPSLLKRREREHAQALEEYRAATEKLGRTQMQIARAMTSIAGSSVQKMLEERVVLKPGSIPAFVGTAVSLAAAAQHNWGRAIGVDRLLLQMEMAVADLEERAKAKAANDVEVELL